VSVGGADVGVSAGATVSVGVARVNVGVTGMMGGSLFSSMAFSAHTQSSATASTTTSPPAARTHHGRGNCVRRRRRRRRTTAVGVLGAASFSSGLSNQSSLELILPRSFQGFGSLGVCVDFVCA
jgi:hypothetical protein